MEPTKWAAAICKICLQRVQLSVCGKSARVPCVCIVCYGVSVLGRQSPKPKCARNNNTSNVAQAREKINCVRRPCRNEYIIYLQYIVFIYIEIFMLNDRHDYSRLKTYETEKEIWTTKHKKRSLPLKNEICRQSERCRKHNTPKNMSK